MDFYGDFEGVLRMIFWELLKKRLVLVLGPRFTDRKYLGTTHTQVKPNANRGLPIKLVSHIQPQQSRLCGKPFCTPTYKMQMGHPHTENFNTTRASWSCTGPLSVRRLILDWTLNWVLGRLILGGTAETKASWFWVRPLRPGPADPGLDCWVYRASLILG